eukprot:7705-Heterococcus_DN1.PRE.6
MAVHTYDFSDRPSVALCMRQSICQAVMEMFTMHTFYDHGSFEFVKLFDAATLSSAGLIESTVCFDCQERCRCVSRALCCRASEPNCIDNCVTRVARTTCDSRSNRVIKVVTMAQRTAAHEQQPFTLSTVDAQAGRQQQNSSNLYAVLCNCFTGIAALHVLHLLYDTGPRFPLIYRYTYPPHTLRRAATALSPFLQSTATP